MYYPSWHGANICPPVSSDIWLVAYSSKSNPAKMNLMFFCKTSKLNNPFLQLQENYFFMNNQTCGILCQVSEQWISPHWFSPPLGVLQSTKWGPSRNSSAAAQPGTQSLSFSVYPVRNDQCPNLSCIKRGTTVEKIMHTKINISSFAFLYHKAVHRS